MSDISNRKFRGITGKFSPSNAEIAEKVISLEIGEADTPNLWFFSVNPPPDGETMEGAIYAQLPMKSQWEVVKTNLNFHATLLTKYITFCGLVPEVTRDGLIHFHAIVRTKPGVDANDVKRVFWNVAMADASKKSHRKYCVNIRQVTTVAVIDYLFAKCEHNYETIIFKNGKPSKDYKPLIWSWEELYHESTEESDSSEDEPDIYHQTQPWKLKLKDWRGMSHAQLMKHDPKFCSS